VDQHKTDSGTGRTSDHQPAERRLARGLEDVSYLFLSTQATSDGAGKGETCGKPVEQSCLSSAEHVIPIVPDPSLSLNRDQLSSLLNRNTAILEAGMRAIDINLPCETGGPISLLAMDRTNRLTIIDLDIVINDSLLMCGISHFDWFVRSVPILKRMYDRHTIDFSSPPRLFLIAPHFSAVLRRVALRIVYPQITCFRFQTAAIPDGTAVLFERV